jgi:hypothetical protein
MAYIKGTHDGDWYRRKKVGERQEEERKRHVYYTVSPSIEGLIVLLLSFLWKQNANVFHLVKKRNKRCQK